MLTGRRGSWIRALTIVVVGAVVFANSLHGPFVFDDHISIIDCPNLRTLWPLSESMSAVDGSGASGRPLVALSLALNYAWGELDVVGYHMLNVTAHLLTALALLGFSRRALLHTRLKDHAEGLAFAIALVWVVHPLNTDALNHVITRHEVFLAGFYLSTLYSADRYFESGKTWIWGALCVLLCTAAMLSKEIAISAPLAVLAYDRTFISKSFRDALNRRKGFYAALAATWIALALAVGSSERGTTVGFGGDLSSLDYLRTQAQGIVHYLRLAFVPTGLSLDYSGWAPVRTWSPAVVPGLIVLALLVASSIAFWRKRPEGFAGLLFFAVLSPSSSFIPLSGEWIAEHRMYLPLTAVIAVVVVWGFCLCQRLQEASTRHLPSLLLLAVVITLSSLTIQRNRDYATEVGIWEDVLANYPENARAHDHLAVLRLHEGELTPALSHAMEAKRIDPELDTVDYNLGTILMQLGKPLEAIEFFELAEERNPDDAQLQGNFGVVLGQTGATVAAIEHLQRAVELSPEYLLPRRNLALILLGAGRAREALPHLQYLLGAQADPQLLELTARVLATDPDATVRNGPEAVRMAQALIQSAPSNPRWQDIHAAALAESGRFAEASEAAQRAIKEARRLGLTEFALEVEERLELYRQEQAYRSSKHL
jgi:protein O-mannosyl-transferase